LDLKWSKKKWKEFEFPKMIYEEITKSAISNILGKGLLEPFGKGMAGMWAAAGGKQPTIVICDGDQIASNDTIRYYCRGGPGKDRQYVGMPLDDRGDDKGPPNYLPSNGVCGICAEYGGGAGKSSKETGSGEQPLPGNVQGPQAPAPRQSSARADAANGDLDRAQNTCTQETAGLPYCNGVQPLRSAYASLRTAADKRGTAEPNLAKAWDDIIAAVNQLGQSQAVLAGADQAYWRELNAGKYGSVRAKFGFDAGQGNEGVYELAKKAKDALAEVAKQDQATNAEPAVITKAETDLKTAREALAKAKELYVATVGEDGAAKALAQATGVQDKDAAKRFALIEEKLKSAESLIDLARTDLKAGGTAMKESWDQLAAAERSFVDRGNLNSPVALPAAKGMQARANVALLGETQGYVKVAGSRMAYGGQEDGGFLKRTADAVALLRNAQTKVNSAYEAALTASQGSVGAAAKSTPVPENAAIPPAQAEAGQTALPENVAKLRGYGAKAKELLGDGAQDGKLGGSVAKMETELKKFKDDAASSAEILQAKNTSTQAGCAKQRDGCFPAERVDATRPPSMPEPPWPEPTPGTAPPAAATSGTSTTGTPAAPPRRGRTTQPVD
ncbi:MAG: hypothetical protein HY925_16885, partial [Elusimicrobia bacterium]|nr:hypothetical protein [Elusimicrobiota bacterium]